MKRTESDSYIIGEGTKRLDVPYNDTESSVTITCVGDIMLGNNVLSKRELKIKRVIEEHGPVFPFKKITPNIDGSDILFGNLESVLSARGTPDTTKDVCFRADPVVASGLSYAGFDAVSLANNHILDFGLEALHETMETLKENGIRFCGAGKNAEDAARPLLIRRNNLSIAFLSYCNAGKWVARSNTPGYIPALRRRILSQLKSSLNGADILVVSLHWGIQDTEYANYEEIKLAHEIIDAGASLIIGHHPHVLRGIEQYKHGIIFYSLGNFIYSGFHRREWREGAIGRCKITRNGVIEVQVIPTIIDEETCQPIKADGEDHSRILERLNHLSREVSDKQSRYTRDANEKLVKFKGKNLLGMNKWYLFRYFYRVRWRHLKALVKYFLQTTVGKSW